MTTLQLAKRRKKPESKQTIIKKVIQWATNELDKAEDLLTKRKYQIILESAKRLDDSGIEKSEISTAIAEGLKHYVSADYIRKVLKDYPQYKDRKKSKNAKSKTTIKGFRKNNLAEDAQKEQSQPQEQTHTDALQELAESTDDAPTGEYQMDVKEWKRKDVPLYDRTFLIKVVYHLDDDNERLRHELQELKTNRNEKA